jgi:two-component system LytT family sensor kinase
VAWWLFWCVVQAFVLHRLGLDWGLSFTDGLISNILLGALGLSAIVLYRFYQPGKSNRMYRFVYAVCITALYVWLLRIVLNYLFSSDVQYLAFLESSMLIRFIIALLIISFITILNWLIGNLDEQKERDHRHNEIQRMAKEAELVKLRQQLQPHFLFNSLNSISALAGSKPEEARKMIQQLSDFLRGTLKRDGENTVPLNEEISHLNLYLEIEKVRFGHRLQINVNIPDACLSMNIPPLLLQPIVENAIKFGLYGTIEAIAVGINASIIGDALVISVSNPYEDGAKIQKGTGFGLTSVQRRLYLLYGRTDLLTTEKNNNIFTTQIRIPNEKSSDHR